MCDASKDQLIQTLREKADTAVYGAEIAEKFGNQGRQRDRLIEARAYGKAIQLVKEYIK